MSAGLILEHGIIKPAGLRVMRVHRELPEYSV